MADHAVDSKKTDWFPGFSPDRKCLFFVSWMYTDEREFMIKNTIDHPQGVQENYGKKRIGMIRRRLGISGGSRVFRSEGFRREDEP